MKDRVFLEKKVNPRKTRMWAGRGLPQSYPEEGESNHLPGLVTANMWDLHEMDDTRTLQYGRSVDGY